MGTKYTSDYFDMQPTAISCADRRMFNMGRERPEMPLDTAISIAPQRLQTPYSSTAYAVAQGGATGGLSPLLPPPMEPVYGAYAPMPSLHKMPPYSVAPTPDPRRLPIQYGPPPTLSPYPSGGFLNQTPAMSHLGPGNSLPLQPPNSIGISPAPIDITPAPIKLPGNVKLLPPAQPRQVSPFPGDPATKPKGNHDLVLLAVVGGGIAAYFLLRSG